MKPKLYSNNVLFFLTGDSRASEFYKTTFRNTMPVTYS